jgi:hypothetical protein
MPNAKDRIQDIEGVLNLLAGIKELFGRIAVEDKGLTFSIDDTCPRCKYTEFKLIDLLEGGGTQVRMCKRCGLEYRYFPPYY